MPSHDQSIDCLEAGFALLPGSRDIKGNPVVFIPLRDNHFKPDIYIPVLQFLTQRAFEEPGVSKVTFVIDMRNGAKADHLKTFLKVLQEQFRDICGFVFILKVDKFWDRQKIEKNRFAFEIQADGLEQLHKIADRSNLLKEFGGILEYNHEVWLNIRKQIDDFFKKINEISQQFEHQSAAIRGFPVHDAANITQTELGHRMDNIDRSIHISIQELATSEERFYHLATNLGNCPNRDFRIAVARLQKAVDNLKMHRHEVTQQLNQKRQEVAIEYSMSCLDSEGENVANVGTNVMTRLRASFYNIGKDLEEAGHLASELNNDIATVNNVNVVYERLEQQNLRNTNSQFASPARQKAGHFKKLQEDWKMLQRALNERHELLRLAVNFHNTYQHYITHAEKWLRNVGVDPGRLVNASIDELKKALDDHVKFKKMFEGSYAVAQNAATQLKNFLNIDRRDLHLASAFHDRSNVFLSERIQNIATTHRKLVGIHESRETSIRNKHFGLVFFDSVQNIINWLDEHGEPFLRRKISIGRTAEDARKLRDNHEAFIAIAKPTFETSKDLQKKADELIKTEEVDSNRATEVLRELNIKLNKFDEKINCRSKLLYWAYSFYTHHKEIMSYYVMMEEKANEYLIIHKDPELCERNKDIFQNYCEQVEQAHEKIMGEANFLEESLKKQHEILNVPNQESQEFVRVLINQLLERRNKEVKRWPGQRIIITFASEVSVFVAESKILVHQLSCWVQDLETSFPELNNQNYLNEVVSESHDQNMSTVKIAVKDAQERKEFLIQYARDHKLAGMKVGNKPVLEVLDQIGKELYEWNKVVMEFARKVQVTFNNKRVLDKIYNDEQGIISNINTLEGELTSLCCTPDNEKDASFYEQEHDTFKNDYKKFIVCRENIITYKEYVEKNTLQFYDSVDINKARNCLDNVRSAQARLNQNLESRLKMLKAAQQYYKMATDTKNVMESMQKRYEDYLSTNKRLKECEIEIQNQDLRLRKDACSERTAKHAEFKITYSNATMFAHKCADNFLKSLEKVKTLDFTVYSNNAIIQKIMRLEGRVNITKEEVIRSQDKFVKHWQQKQDMLHECTNAALLRVAMDDICEQLGGLKERLAAGTSSPVEDAQAQLERLKDIRQKLKMVKKVKQKMTSHANEMFLERTGQSNTQSPHFNEIKANCDYTHSQYLSTEKELHRQEAECRSLFGGDGYAFDRNSDGSLDEKLTQHSLDSVNSFGGDSNHKLRKSMNELLETEKQYIADLETGITVYLKSYRENEPSYPESLRNKEYEIFGNIEDIHRFHSTEFLDQLRVFERNPEDVGIAFIRCVNKLQELYTEYCLNKAQNENIFDSAETNSAFEEIREAHQVRLSHSISSVLIKPVQRITRYHLLLSEIMRYSKNDSEQMKEASNVVSNIPRVANDRMHLSYFEKSDLHQIGEFLIQDSFMVSDPKRVFKKERELQVFLFESSVVFTKKEELPNKKIRYTYKYKYLTDDCHVVEHVGGDATKFGLKRNGALANGDSELVLKASNEKTRTSWVMKLRQLTLPAPLITQDPLTQNKKKIDIDMNSNLPKTSVSSLNGIVMRKGSQDSGLPKADFAFTDEPLLGPSTSSSPLDPRNTVYSTTSSDLNDLPPTMDQLSLVCTTDCEE